MQVNTIKLENGQNMLVEVVDVKVPDDAKQQNKSSTNIQVPVGAHHIGVGHEVQASISLLKDNLKSIANTVQDSFKENQPDEFSVEVNFGFAGEGAIPFIASAQANAGIKVKATWEKGS